MTDISLYLHCRRGTTFFQLKVYLIKRKFASFFSVNTKYISSSELKTSLDEIFLVFTSKQISSISPLYCFAVSGANDVSAEKLDVGNARNKAINAIREERIKQLENELKEEKEKRMALEVEVESIRDKCSVLDTHRDILHSQQMIIDVITENISTIASDNKELENRIQSTESSLNESKEIWRTTEDFQSSLRLAFREEKHFVRNLTRGLQKQVHHAVEDIKIDINTTISELRQDIIGLQNNASEPRRCCDTFEELDDRVSEAGKKVIQYFRCA